jgi:hypothetical protein
MITVLRSGGLRFVIYLDDHEPAHVHVIGDGEAKINLVGEPDLVWNRGLSRGDLRHAMQAIATHREALLGKWSDIHG